MKLTRFWIDENGQYKFPSMWNDNRQRWWKNTEERLFPLTEAICSDFNATWGKYCQISTKTKAWTYKSEILLDV